MFSNQYFTVKVLIGGIPVPEYVKAGQNFVESNLNTPLTYKDELVEDVDGCAEKQVRSRLLHSRLGLTLS